MASRQSKPATKTKSLRVGVLGPKGQCGSCVVDELLSRGHSVVGIYQSPPKTWPTEGDYSGLSVDSNKPADLTKALSADFDAIVCAFGPPLNDINHFYFHCIETHCKIKTALLASTHEGPFVIIGMLPPSFEVSPRSN